MKMYKLELENRELSYNKMFGTTPNVGVVNPTGKTPGVTVRQASGTKENLSGLGVGGKTTGAVKGKGWN